MKSAVTISLVPEAKGGPFVFWDDLPAACVQAGRLGFDAVEIFPPSGEAVNPAQLRELLAQNRLQLAGAGTGAGWVKHKLRLTDPDAAIRRRAIEFAAGIIDFAGQFGAPAIIGSMQGRADSAAARPQAVEWLGQGLQELAGCSARHGVSLLFEPLNRYETDLFTRQADAADFLRSLQATNIRLLCDLFHMNIEEHSMSDALRKAGPLVGHVHFADSNRHAIGFGHSDLKPVMTALREIGFAGYLSAEVLPLPDSPTAALQSLQSFRLWTAAAPPR